MRARRMTMACLALLASLGCDRASMTYEEDPHNTWAGYAEQAALAAATGGVPLGDGFIWTGDAAIAAKLTRHGTPTSLEDIQRMSPVKYARAQLAAAEVDLYEVRDRLAYLEGPDAKPLLPTGTLAEDIAEHRRGIAYYERLVQELEDELELTIRNAPHYGRGAMPPPPKEPAAARWTSKGPPSLRSVQSLPGHAAAAACICGRNLLPTTRTSPSHPQTTKWRRT